jgi:hypothetical protein
MVSATGTVGGSRAVRVRAAFAASAPLLLGVALAALVCYPFVGGRLLLLDFVSGPHQPFLPAAAFGLDGGLTGGVPLAIGFHLLDRLLGQAGSVVPAAVFFPLATTGAARLVRTAVLPARLGAGLFYAVNPFVFDRLYAGRLPAGTSARLRVAALRSDRVPRCRARASPRRPRRLLGRGHGDDERALRVDSPAPLGFEPGPQHPARSSNEAVAPNITDLR